MTDFLARPFLTKTGHIISIVFFLLLLSACSVHKIDIQQGNVITQEMFEKLKIGMDKRRVEGTLGTPLIVDPFHRDRWDYVYIYEAGNTDEQQSAHLTVYFENDQLSKIDVQSVLPKESEVKKPGSSLHSSSSAQGQGQGGHAH
ncbi:MAG: outer membrane protein assembly factor BamE [Gammaproteobacteria bacterium]|nr:outer membrane protein assembly factor BamE [Gammaproteobacteria bacterium]